MPGTVKLWVPPRHSRGVSPVYASGSDPAHERINVNIVADRDRFLAAGRQRNAEAARRELERT